MQSFKCLLLISLQVFLVSIVSAQESIDGKIRQLEDAERQAILKGDTVKLRELMSLNIVVQNPENAIVGFRQIMDRVKNGKINYASFERTIDRVSFFNNTSVVMGQEIIVPQGSTVNAGKTVTRRFTNIWMKENGIWKLTARQSTIVSIQ